MSTDKRVNHLEMLTSARGANIYAMTTTDPLSRVLQGDYMSHWAEHGLRRHDRVMVTVSVEAEQAETAWRAGAQPDNTTLLTPSSPRTPTPGTMPWRCSQRPW